MSLLQIGVLAVVALILGIFVVRPLLLPRRQTAELPALTTPSFASDQAADIPVLSGTIEPDMGKTGLLMLSDRGAQPDGLNTEDAVARLKNLIEERRSETVEVLRSWLDDPRPGDAR